MAEAPEIILTTKDRWSEHLKVCHRRLAVERSQQVKEYKHTHTHTHTHTHIYTHTHTHTQSRELPSKIEKMSQKLHG